MTERIRCEKQKFASRGKADRAREMIRKFGDRTGDRKPQRAYLCPFCRHWHLTSEPEGS